MAFFQLGNFRVRWSSAAFVLLGSIMSFVWLAAQLSEDHVQIEMARLVQHTTTPEVDRNGWNPEAVPLTAEAVAAMPPFQIVGPNGEPIAQANETAVVKLWKGVMNANGGRYPVNIAQQIGDCTSFGLKHAIEDSEGTTFANGQGTFAEIFAPFSYGIGRVQILHGQIRGDGCSGAAVAYGAQKYGFVSVDEAHSLGYSYSGELARKWGQTGPPDDLIQLAASHKVKTVSKVANGVQGWDGIANGYGVTIASNFGSKTFKPRDGRIVARWDGSWSHQMSADGIDGSGQTRYVHIQNSWGEKWSPNPDPIDDSPKGGFWITFDDFDRMVKQGDSFVISDVDGFPQRDLNFNVFGDKGVGAKRKPDAKKTLLAM